MILYSIIDEDFLKDEIENMEPMKLKSYNIGGTILEVSPFSDNKAEVVRVISTDPGDYLNQKYTPGSTIDYSALS